ncbi:MAG: FprA family A-type flavoprotein [Candidatus Caldatribacteriota bacterium]|nr:FprA family A-type flavoprotein [Candidatus Caldatribacteriota bacterium]
MTVKKIKKDIYWVGAIDWDRRLFDELIPLPEGTSYNAYLIKGQEKTALIDTVDPTKEDDLLDNLDDLGIEHLDYIVVNHAEQDHSGAIPLMLELYSEAKIVTNQKCKKMLMEHLFIKEDKIITINDNDTLSLGGKTLRFIFAPWVHWPETMLTYLEEDKILFSCDLFGAHIAESNLWVDDESKVYFAAKRYYAEIMMPFRNNIKKYLERLKDLEIKTIAPSHGQIYSHPEFILSAYREWISDEVENEVIIPYVSMHGSVEEMVYILSEELMRKGITVKLFNLSRTDIGALAIALVDAATIVIASPTVLTGAHPQVVSAVYLANALRPKLRYASVIGSYGWGGKMLENISSMIGNLKVEILSPVIVKGYPQEGDYNSLIKLAGEIAEKHKNL